DLGIFLRDDRGVVGAREQEAEHAALDGLVDDLPAQDGRVLLDDRLFVDDDEPGDVAKAERARRAALIGAYFLRAQPRQVEQELRDRVFVAPLVLRRELAVGLPVGLAADITATQAPLERVDAPV